MQLVEQARPVQLVEVPLLDPDRLGHGAGCLFGQSWRWRPVVAVGLEQMVVRSHDPCWWRLGYLELVGQVGVVAGMWYGYVEHLEVEAARCPFPYWSEAGYLGLVGQAGAAASVVAQADCGACRRCS